MIVIYYNKKTFRFLSVVGDFIDKKDVVEKVDLGQSFQFRCPQHTAGFGAVYSWIHNKWDTHFSRNERRGISPDGTLSITYVTQEDIDDIDETQGIKCRMTAGNSYQNSGRLKLEKNNPEQSGKAYAKKGREIVRQFPRINGTETYRGVNLVAPIARRPACIGGKSSTQRLNLSFQKR